MKLFVLFLLAASTLLAQEPAAPTPATPPREIAGHRTVLGAQASARPNPIPVRSVYGAGRDWVRQPYRLAVLLVEFTDQKHEPAHSSALYDELLFSRDKYL